MVTAGAIVCSCLDLTPIQGLLCSTGAGLSVGCTMSKKEFSVFIPESRKGEGYTTGMILQSNKEAFPVLCMISFGNGKVLLDSSLSFLSTYFLLSFFSSFFSLFTGWVSESSPAGTEVELQTGLLCTLLNAFSSKLNN